jgi:hypothetical protein
MGRITKAEAPQVEKMEGFEGRYAEIDGYTVGFETYTIDNDPAELFRGLPDDRCQCPHWGVVLRGELTYRYADGTQDVIRTGEAYYARPGHTPVFSADTEIVEFSPTTQLAETMEVVIGNLQTAQQR